MGTRKIAFWFVVLVFSLATFAQAEAYNGRLFPEAAPPQGPGSIIRPTIGFPTIQEEGKTFLITVNTSEGTSNVNDWKVR
ncbi:MAG: hypothetical protein ABIL62_16455, partial [Planctomycetota bacterium]